MAESLEERGSAVVSSAGDPGPLSRLLQEIFEAPSEDLLEGWKKDLQPGDSVGRFEIRREVGRGGFGAVYEAFDTELNRPVAVKTLRLVRPRKDLSSDWIKQEAEAVARLDHPCIVTLFDVGTGDSGPYLVMELLRGMTLARRIAEGPIPPAEALRIAEEMAKGLAHAHQRGVLHRDLKPANVFLCEDGRVKLLDFGLAHLLGAEGAGGAGTPAYMAPEQARGEVVDQRADVYAAGMVLGEMLTGTRPPRAFRRVPRPAAKAVAAAVATDPALRPPDGMAWLASLQAAREAIERPRRARRVVVLASIGVAIGLASAGFATWRIWERQIPGGRPTVAVADFSNETGESELDALSGLLITSLEQGTQLRVLTRGRMVDLLKQLGKEKVDRIDEPLAREVGKEARASALLLGSVRKLGDVYVVEMRALDPLHDEYLFTVSERATGRVAVLDLIDRLGETTRRRIKAGAVSESTGTRKVASITTGSVTAWELLSQSRQAFDQADHGESLRLAEAALKEDPEFALAHYQIARLDWWKMEGSLGAREDLLQRLTAAEKRADRLPEKERAHLKAMRALMDVRYDEGIRLLDQLAEAYPLDKEALFYAGDIRFHRDEVVDAIPYFERCLQLDPGYGLALDHFIGALNLTGRARERLVWIRSRLASARSPLELSLLGRALLGAGEVDEAFTVLRKSVEVTGATGPHFAVSSYLIHVGRADEAESGMRAALAASPVKGIDRGKGPKRRLAHALIAQGRMSETRALLAESGPDPIEAALWEQRTRAIGGEVAHVRAAADALERAGSLADPDQGADAALSAALAGDAALAGALARVVLGGPEAERFPPDERRLLMAMVAWGEGALDTAERELNWIATRPLLPIRYLGMLLSAKLARARGNCVPSIPVLEESQRLPWVGPLVVHRAGTHAIELHLLALCYEQTGDIARARERNNEFLRRWARADPDLPLLAEAKALRTRLAENGSK